MKYTIIAAVLVSSCTKTYTCTTTIDTTGEYPQHLETSIDFKGSNAEKDQYEEDNTHTTSFSYPSGYSEIVVTECK